MTDVVPEGHRLDVTSASPLPCLVKCKGGAWIAQLGLASDDLDGELATIITELEAQLARPRPPRVVVAQGIALAALYAPGNPPVTPCEGFLAWVIDAAALSRAPAAVARLLAQLRAHPIAQSVFIRDASAPGARSVVAAIQALGIDTRELEAPGEAVLVEVVRPDHFVITAVAGKPCPPYAAEAFPERAAPVDRAPRLRALLLASADASRRALYAELVAREIPFVAVAHSTGALRLRTWPNGFTGIPVYADRVSLLAAVNALEGPSPSFVVAEVAPRALFEFASAQGLAVAINVLDDAGHPLYLAIDQADVHALARGELPAQNA